MGGSLFASGLLRANRLISSCKKIPINVNNARKPKRTMPLNVVGTVPDKPRVRQAGKSGLLLVVVGEVPSRMVVIALIYHALVGFRVRRTSQRQVAEHG